MDVRNLGHVTLAALLLATASACSSDGEGADTGINSDNGAIVDTGVVVDTGTEVDTGQMDTGAADAAMEDAGPIVKGIAAARAAPDGPTSIIISNVLVTYIRSVRIGNDEASFFVQVEPTGPALYVQTLPDGLSVGDEVSFRVTSVASPNQLRRATSIVDFITVSTGNDVTSLIQDVSNAPDLITHVDDYETELIAADFDIVGDFEVGGLHHVRAEITTATIARTPNLHVRTTTVIHDLHSLRPGCSMRISGTPLWDFNGIVQLSAWAEADIESVTCP